MKQVKPKKNLGQHFLTDLSIARRIADTVDACPDIPVLEIGPGMGVLTQFLLTKPRPVCAVEIDRESIAYLRQHFPAFSTPLPTGEGPGVGLTEEGQGGALISGDFLRMDLRELFGGRQFVLTGNYPYDISSQIFFKMLDNRDLIPCCTGMIQHEVALRMAAQPGSKVYGILSVLIQAWYDVEYLFTVEPSVFNPPPKVQSAVIRMTRNDVDSLGCNEQLFRRIVKTVFNQRRKMLRVSLRQLLSADAIAALQQSLETTAPLPTGEKLGVGLKELSTLRSAQRDAFRAKWGKNSQLSTLFTLRPEQLTIPQFVALTNLLEPFLQSFDSQ
ncbi:MAG: ribosomal RNA small subunit methyltransferase A [Prevotella sp.]|nr:ribosomal RNA small subunit methyltransferase A [Prevotella sp.]